MSEPKPACAKGRNYSCFTHRECEFFPCHPDVAEAEFNCLFCYCPLYGDGAACGGDFMYLPNGVKDCSDCAFPHRPENYDAIIGRLIEKDGENG